VCVAIAMEGKTFWFTGYRQIDRYLGQMLTDQWGTKSD